MKLYHYTIVAALIVCAFFAGRYISPRYKETIRVQRDTLTFRETLTIEKPVPKLVRVHDTLRIPIEVFVHDSASVTIPIEQKIYSDSNYRAVVSGFHASLDSISVYPRTMVISERTERVLKQRWTLGASVGVGAFYGFTTRKVDAGVGVMVGIHYNF